MSPHMTEDQLQESIIKASKGYMKTAASYCIDYHEVLSALNFAAAKSWKQFTAKPDKFESYEKERNYLHHSFKFAFFNLLRDEKTKKRLDEISEKLFKDGYYVHNFRGKQKIMTW